jgi:hypothetical protein
MEAQTKSKAISPSKLLEKKFIDMPFEGKWLGGIGVPEKSGVWIIWGNPGNGKTTGALMLAKYLTSFGKVIYNSLEEGTRKTFQMAIKRTGINEVKGRILLLNREPFEELKERLRKRQSPAIVFIDSLQYLGLTKKQYIAFKEEFNDKLIIFISHAEGKNPEGKVAKFVRYDADVKMFCEGYRFFITSRYEGGLPITISEEKAKKYWGEGVAND